MHLAATHCGCFVECMHICCMLLISWQCVYIVTPLITLHIPLVVPLAVVVVVVVVVVVCVVCSIVVVNFQCIFVLFVGGAIQILFFD